MVRSASPYDFHAAESDDDCDAQVPMAPSRPKRSRPAQAYAETTDADDEDFVMAVDTLARDTAVVPQAPKRPRGEEALKQLTKRHKRLQAAFDKLAEECDQLESENDRLDAENQHLVAKVARLEARVRAAAQNG